MNLSSATFPGTHEGLSLTQRVGLLIAGLEGRPRALRPAFTHVHWIAGASKTIVPLFSSAAPNLISYL